MDIGLKLRQRRKELGLSMKEIADKIGVSEATVSRWESGQIANMKRNFVPAYAKALNVPTEFIMGFEDEIRDRGDKKESYSESGSSRTVRIPVFSFVSAGTGAYADESNIECYVDISDDLAKHGDYFGVRVKGDSMLPDIKDSDIIIVRSQSVAQDGDTVVAVVNGDEGFCKRFAVYGNSIGLISNNPAYKPMIFTKKEVDALPVRIMGVVVELRRTI